MNLANNAFPPSFLQIQQWCTRVSAQMHEVGHNLGLAHSGEAGNTYGDQSGMMGYSYNQDEQKMCFNAAKNWQLGWYSNQALALTNLGPSPAAPTTYKMCGVDNYVKTDVNNAMNQWIVMKLPGITSTDGKHDYYVGYNHKDGINANTVEGADQVMIVQKALGTDYSYAQSWLVGKLTAGSTFTFTGAFNNNGVSLDVLVSFDKYTDTSKNCADVTVSVVETPDPPPGLIQISLMTDNYGECCTIE